MSSRIRPLLLLAVPLALAALAAPSAQQREPRTQPFEQAELFLELNDTDGDLGLHAAIDGGTWTRLEIEDPRERPLLDIFTRTRLLRQGLTQLAFESAEPAFDELDPAAFFARFPEGLYEIEAKAQDGGEFESSVRLSHVLAAPPEAMVSGTPAAESCDASSLPQVSSPVVIDWEPVTSSHPDIGKKGPVTIARYQFFLERDETQLSVDLPPSVTEFEIPMALTAAPGQYKFEIIARTSTGNNTAIESCFVVR
jgi:hypothetical protein